MGKRRKGTKRYQRRRNMIIAVSTAMIMLFSVFLGIGRVAAPKQEKKQESVFPDYSKITVQAPLIQDMLLTKNINSRPGIKRDLIRGIVIHYTANPDTDARANRNYFESRKNMEDEKGNKVSSHYIIGLSGDIIRCVPDDEISYASNQRNKDTIAIECCHPDRTGKFSTETYQSLIHLVSYLADQYEISMDEIIRHYDVTGKNCPKYYVRHEDAWLKLKNDVEIYLKKSMKNA